MPRANTPFNAAPVKHKRNFTHIEPKGAYDATDTWWDRRSDPNKPVSREEFMAARDTQLPRLMKAKAVHTTAESGTSGRQSFVARRPHSIMGWAPARESAE